jgi:hypothetical protein
MATPENPQNVPFRGAQAARAGKLGILSSYFSEYADQSINWPDKRNDEVFKHCSDLKCIAQISFH